MGKFILITVFVALFLFMIADLILNFNSKVKTITYGGMFILGVAIYIFENGFSFPKNTEKK